MISSDRILYQIIKLRSLLEPYVGNLTLHRRKHYSEALDVQNLACQMWDNVQYIVYHATSPKISPTFLQNLEPGHFFYALRIGDSGEVHFPVLNDESYGNLPCFLFCLSYQEVPIRFSVNCNNIQLILWINMFDNALLQSWFPSLISIIVGVLCVSCSNHLWKEVDISIKDNRLLNAHSWPQLGKPCKEYMFLAGTHIISAPSSEIKDSLLSSSPASSPATTLTRTKCRGNSLISSLLIGERK